MTNQANDTREVGGAAAAAGKGGASEARPTSDSELSSIDFSTFILSLSTTALYQLGLVDDPDSGERSEANLPLARQTIDTLEMLHRKTRGNLELEEQKLFESLLYELRVRYVEASG